MSHLNNIVLLDVSDISNVKIFHTFDETSSLPLWINNQEFLSRSKRNPSVLHYLWFINYKIVGLLNTPESLLHFKSDENNETKIWKSTVIKNVKKVKSEILLKNVWNSSEALYMTMFQELHIFWTEDEEGNPGVWWKKEQVWILKNIWKNLFLNR